MLQIVCIWQCLLKHGINLNSDQEGSGLKIGKGNKTENQAENASEGGGAQPEALSSRRCSKYAKPGYNIRTCLDILIDPILLETE